MISDEELKNRKAFEAQLVEVGSLVSTAWDDDYDEYVYDTAEEMYRGWTLAQDALLSTRLDLETARKELAAKDREIEGLKVVAASLVEVGYLEREEGYGIYDSSIDDHAAFEFEDHTKLYAFKKPRSTIPASGAGSEGV